MTNWKRGRGRLGPLQPLIGNWRTESGRGDAAAAVYCERSFAMFGKQWVRLDALWRTGPDRAYRETAFFGNGENQQLTVFSFTNDGKRSIGAMADGSDVHPSAIAFEAHMPAGLARMIYWPRDDGMAGFDFAVENRSKRGWNRFLRQRFAAASVS